MTNSINPAFVTARDLPAFEPLYRCIVPTFTPVAAANGGEAERHRASVENRRRETTPPVVVHHPLGMWAIDYTGDLWHLEELEIAALERMEEPYGNIVAKYAAWIGEGHTPPPIRVLQMQSGTYRVSDGHHRTAALEHTGAKTIRAWVSPPGRIMRLFGLSYEEAVTTALLAGVLVPLRVAREYPRMHQVYRDLLNARRTPLLGL